VFVSVCITVGSWRTNCSISICSTKEDPFEIDAQAAHLFKHQRLGIEDIREVWACDPMLRSNHSSSVAHPETTLLSPLFLKKPKQHKPFRFSCPDQRAPNGVAVKALQPPTRSGSAEP
jgi:hypothetical protein